MAINWDATIWRGLAVEARNAARKFGNRAVRLQTVVLAARYAAKAARAEQSDEAKERDEQSDKAK
jgi:hypothetical protein